MIIKTKFKDLILVRKNKFYDSRGYFQELLLEKDINKSIKFYGNCNYSKYLKNLI